MATWGLSIEIVTSLASISASSPDPKRIQSPDNLFNKLGADQTFTIFLVRRQSSSLNPSSSPCCLSGNYSQRLFQKKIECFVCKING